MNIDSILKSKVLHVTLSMLGGFFLLVLVFHAGQIIGFRKAELSLGLLGGRGAYGYVDQEFLREFVDREVVNSHGVSGVVVSVAEPFFIMQSSSGLEREVSVSGNTIIRRGPSSITLQELRPLNRVVVLGSTEDTGTLEAKFVRILDPILPVR